MSLDELFLRSIKCNDLNMIRVLIAQGADVKTIDKALRCASVNGHLEVVKFLVSMGVDVRANSDEALIVASHNGHLEIVKFLISMGADVRSWYNEALRRASHKGHLEVVEYLKSVYRKNNFEITRGCYYESK